MHTLASGAVHTTAYSYTPQRLLDTLTYPGGGQLRHLYDASGQLTALHWNGQPLVAGLAWNALGQPTGWSWAFATPLPASRSYDTAGRMTANEAASYTWDAAGRISALTQQLGKPGDADPNSASISFGPTTFSIGYDALGRITRFADGSASASFTYDANGNRLSSQWSEGSSSVSRSYTVEAASNRLAGYSQTATGPGGSAAASLTYTYNANGDITAEGARRYAYDPEGRLASSATGDADTAAVTKYAHNVLGQRVFKTEALYPAIDGQGQTQEEQEQSWWSQLMAYLGQLWAPQAHSAEQLGWAYAYDEQGTLIGEYGSGGAQSTGSTQYIWLPTPSGPMPVATIINGSKYAVHADHLNTPRRLTNEQGQAVWQWAYSAFGDEQPTLAANRFAWPHDNAGTTNIAPIAFNLRYPGQYYDKESGLHYNYFRSYDKDSGRYTQVDPIGWAGGPNGFAYAENSPLVFTDALGLQSSGGPYHPPEGVSTKCTDADTCPDIQGKLHVLKRMIDSHQGWDRQMPSPRGGGRHAAEIADLWRAYARCQTLWQKKDCDNCKPEGSFGDWLKRALGPKVEYDPVQDREVVAPNKPFIPVLPGSRRTILP